ncbi:MAG: alkaline phosphatase family protein [Candidatus Cloacimonetes bacterium]|nr:alkaline phosphatase family protein [Candidatus Cloacimonadota bacterium]
MNFMLPDYTNSIVNLAASIQAAYDVIPAHPALKQLTIHELKKYDNVVLFLFDGFGKNLLDAYASRETAFLAAHQRDPVTSVFPSTTTAAITSLRSGLTPWEHGALGWTLFFKEYAKFIDFLPNWDSITTKTLPQDSYDTLHMLKFDNIYQQINQRHPELQLYYLTSKYLMGTPYTDRIIQPATSVPYKNLPQMIKKVEKLAKKPGQKLIMTYYSDPDHTQHIEGVFNPKVKSIVTEINDQLQKLQQRLAGTKTLCIMTADHGLTDMKKYYYTEDNEALYDSMILPTFPEPRFISFFIKPHKKAQFDAAIAQYQDDFRLFTRDEFMESGILGNGPMHPKVDDFIGDYVLIAAHHAGMKTTYRQNGRWEKEFKGHHCGLTPDEMLVPLIVF